MGNKLVIDRAYFNDCVIGRVSYGSLNFFSLELPSRNNQTNVSCIPSGVYQCKKIVSPSLGECIEVCDVEGRTFIRIHTGNYTSQIEGCILIGDGIKYLNQDNIPDITNSRVTFDTLMMNVPNNFILEIK